MSSEDLKKMLRIPLDYIQDTTGVYLEKQSLSVSELLKELCGRIMIKTNHSSFPGEDDIIAYYQVYNLSDMRQGLRGNIEQLVIFRTEDVGRYEVMIQVKDGGFALVREEIFLKCTEVYPDFRKAVIFTDACEERILWYGEIEVLMKACEKLLELDGYVVIEE